MEELAERVHCPYCGHAQRIDPARLAELRGYRDEAVRDLDEAASHRADERAWRATTRRMQQRSAWVLVFMAPCMLGSVLGFAGIPLAHAAGLSDWNTLDAAVKTAIAIGIAGFSIIVGGGGAALALVSSRRHDRERAAAVPPIAPAPARPVAGTVLCPRCGGPNELHAGVATEECTFCHSTFAPDAAVRAAGLDASERARREAALSRYRQERMTVATYASQGGTRRNIPTTAAIALLGAVTAPMFCIMSCVGAVQLLTDESAELSWAQVLGSGAAGTVLLAAAVVLGWVAWGKIRRERERFREHAQSYGGERIVGVMGTARWLGTHWAGPYELELLSNGEGYLGAHGSIAGYPWLFELAPARRRAQVLVAAFFTQPPDPTRAPEDAQRMLAELDAQRAHTSVGEAGVRVRIDPAAASPEHVPALRDRLVLLATRLGGRPVHDG
jgi:hypothetical protein